MGRSGVRESGQWRSLVLLLASLAPCVLCKPLASMEIMKLDNIDPEARSRARRAAAEPNSRHRPRRPPSRRAQRARARSRLAASGCVQRRLAGSVLLPQGERPGAGQRLAGLPGGRRLVLLRPVLCRALQRGPAVHDHGQVAGRDQPGRHLRRKPDQVTLGRRKQGAPRPGALRLRSPHLTSPAGPLRCMWATAAATRGWATCPRARLRPGWRSEGSASSAPRSARWC